MDSFAQLPNEVLQEVFKHVKSLPDKFKLAAVSQRFRGNVMKIMEEPILWISFKHKLINGFKIPVNNWPAAVEVLAKRTPFSGISIDGEGPEGLLDTILNILNGTEHMNEVILFQTTAGCNSAILEQFLAKCEQLTALKLEFPLSRFPTASARAVHLGTVFNNKELLFLTLELDEYPVEQLSAAIQLLVPNKLRFLRMEIRHPLNLVQLMIEVPDGVWSALTSLRLSIQASNDPQLELLEVVARMPQLRDCSILFYPTEITVNFDQLANAVASLFNNHQGRAEQLTIKYCDLRFEGQGVPGCVLIHMYRVLQQQHPQLQMSLGFGRELGFQLRLANTTLYSAVRIDYCEDECLECRSFYTNLIFSLVEQGENHTSGHLEGHQLDKCKIERVVEDHNLVVASPSLEGYGNALLLTVNEANDMVTVTFEMEGHEQFYITIDCGPCFDHSCVTCRED